MSTDTGSGPQLGLGHRNKTGQLAKGVVVSLPLFVWLDYSRMYVPLLDVCVYVSVCVRGHLVLSPMARSGILARRRRGGV